jgi:tetratricopeptide (TPR) repeat protein
VNVALALASRLGARSLEGYIHANRGVAQARLGQLDAAVQSEQTAFKIAADSGDQRLLSACGTYLALVCLDRGAARDVPRAQSAAVAALAAARDASLEEFQALAHMALARVYLACGEKDDALREARDAVRRRERLRGVQEREEEIYWTLVQALEATGHGEEAGVALAAAKRLVEKKAARLQDAELRRSFLEGVPANRSILAAAAVKGPKGSTSPSGRADP